MGKLLTTLLTDWANLAQGNAAVSGKAFADALLRACEGLSDEVLRSLPATPDDAAAALSDMPFADRADGAYLPWAWLEPFVAHVGLPVAELTDGWDLSDGEDVYWCPRVMLADDPNTPQDVRPFVRVDQIRRWPEPAVEGPC